MTTTAPTASKRSRSSISNAAVRLRLFAACAVIVASLFYAFALTRLSSLSVDTRARAKAKARATTGGRGDGDGPAKAYDKPTPEKKPTPVVRNVLMGMMGDGDGILAEWGVCLKSTLMNAPIDAALHVHVVTDAKAAAAVRSRVSEWGVNGTLWRNSIRITTYDVERLLDDWRKLVEAKIRPNNKLDSKVTLGGYFRLLAYRVLRPLGLGMTLYVDVDVVVMANLDDLFKNHVDPLARRPPRPGQEVWGALYMITARPRKINSGFLVVNMDRFGDFWDYVDRLPDIPHGGDQTLLTYVKEQFPHEVGGLPPEWDVHLGNIRYRPHKLLEKQPRGVGMMHFCGSDADNYFAAGLDHYCKRSPYCDDEPGSENMTRFGESWGLAEYYINMPWEWAIYIGESMAAGSHGGGVPLVFSEEIVDKSETLIGVDLNKTH